MVKLLKSSKGIPLPTLYYVTDREDLKDIPIGIPFIYGTPTEEKYIVRLLEYEVLWKSAMKTGYPFNFKQILKDNGFNDLEDMWFNRHTVYMDYVTDGLIESCETDVDFKLTPIEGKDRLADFVKDSSVYVDIQKLKDLHIIPVWVDIIEEAVKTNIHNFITINPLMYNKKLDGMYGGIELSPPPRNLIIIDISGSIPRAVSSTCLTMAKHLSSTFYADILITGSKSTLYEYENIHTLDVKNIYEENGMDNDQVYFKNLVSSNYRHYKTAIVFGDNHSPSGTWKNVYNKETRQISREDGQKLCKWEIDHLISFHTTSTDYTAGYADWFTPATTEKISNWVKYLE